MNRSELNTTDFEIMQLIQLHYKISIQKLHFIPSIMFFCFIAETKEGERYFLKIYPKQKLMMANVYPTEKLLNSIGESLKRFRDEYKIENFSYCILTSQKNYCVESGDYILVLFEYIENTENNTPNPSLLLSQLHHIPTKEFPDLLTEDFDISYALESDRLKELREIVLKKSYAPVITHGDPHAKNIIHNKQGLWLTDWDNIKIGPVERDLWFYPDETLDKDLVEFYHQQRFYEDCHYYLSQNDQSAFLRHWEKNQWTGNLFTKYSI